MLRTFRYNDLGYKKFENQHPNRILKTEYQSNNEPKWLNNVTKRTAKQKHNLEIQMQIKRQIAVK